eukprot:TRINITY_DN9507_c0_g1_i2.p1 TRINITY_DN9507_c0_g1~~TRINITY_DN9507_c0_g1_i2.p1  ORF type:complete len:614 (+),score=80.94 TRINITY_DN9507_c0_g1_i2:72-1844(+)
MKVQAPVVGWRGLLRLLGLVGLVGLLWGAALVDADFCYRTFDPGNAAATYIELYGATEYWRDGFATSDLCLNTTTIGNDTVLVPTNNPNPLFIRNSGTQVSDMCYGGSLALLFSGRGERFVETHGFDLTGGGTLQFRLFIAPEGNPPPCEGVDANEEIRLEYSRDDGDHWLDMAMFDGRGYMPEVYNWTLLNIPVPQGGWVNNTRFRWVQRLFTQGDFDVWGIDDIAIYGYPGFTGCPPQYRVRCVDGACTDDATLCSPLPSSSEEGGEAILLKRYDFDSFDDELEDENWCFANETFFEIYPQLNSLRLQPSEPHLIGGITYNSLQRVKNGFNTTFDFRITQRGFQCISNVTQSCLPQAADGFAFLIRGLGSGLLDQQGSRVDAPFGENGKYLGYGGLPDCIAIEFDQFTNGELHDLFGHHVAIHTLEQEENNPGVDTLLGYANCPDFSDGAVHTGQIEYRTAFFDPNAEVGYVEGVTSQFRYTSYSLSLLEEGAGIISVRLDNELILVTPANVGKTISLGYIPNPDGTFSQSDSAFVGFTSSTGSSFGDIDILRWKFCEESACTSYLASDPNGCPRLVPTDLQWQRMDV